MPDGAPAGGYLRRLPANLRPHARVPARAAGANSLTTALARVAWIIVFALFLVLYGFCVQDILRVVHVCDSTLRNRLVRLRANHSCWIKLLF
eukprot:COSAG05_NODE_538_length_8854_cov_306.308738_14_plen_92_part_00